MKKRNDKDTKRRLALQKQNARGEKRIAKYGNGSVAVMAQDVNRRFVAAFLALVFALSCLVVGVNFATRAEDGKDYETAYKIILTNGNYTVTQADIEAGLTSGCLCKYVGSDGKTYAFSVPSDFDLQRGDYFELDTSTSPNSIKVIRDPRIAQDGESLEKLSDHVQDNGNGTLTIDSANQNHALTADTTYWYQTLPDDNNVYFFTPDQDYGYKAVELREEGEMVNANNGALTITLNTTTPNFNISGIQWRRHAIYEKATSLSANNVYLIVGNEASKRYMLFYDDSTYWQGTYYDMDLFSGAHCSHSTKGENVYNITYPDKTNALIASSASSAADTSKQILYNSIGANSPTVHTNYFDGLDGSLAKDPYVYAEFSTYYKKISDWYSLGGGFPLMAYDGNTGYYTTAKAFGSYGSSYRQNQSQLWVKYLCSGATTVIKHYNGSLWTYSGGKLYNNNSLAGALSGYRYVKFSTTRKALSTLVEGKWYVKGFYGYESSSNGDIEIYQMKNVYDKNTVDDTFSATIKQIQTAKAPVISLENATVKLAYDGADNATKGVGFKLKLKDANNAEVSGTYPGILSGSDHDFVFSNGVCTETVTLKNTQSAIITNIPYGYSIAVETNEDELNDTETSITNVTDSDQINFGEFVTLNTDKEIDINILRETTIALVVEAPDGVADVNAQFCGYYDYDSSGKAAHSLDNNDDTGEIIFVPVFSDSDPTDLTKITPGKYSLGTKMPIYGNFSDTKVYARINAGFKNGVSTNKYSVTAYLNGAQILTFATPAPYMDVSSGWRESGGMPEHTLNFKTDNVIRVVYTGINQNVVVAHNVEGSTADKANAENLKLKLTLLTSESGTGVPMTIQDTTGASYTFGDDGVCITEISLADNANKTFIIPYGYYLKVEDADDYSDVYSTSYKDNNNTAKNIIQVDEGNSVTVTHTRNAHDVIINEITSGTYANLSRSFPLDLSLTKEGKGVTASITVSGDIAGALQFVNGTLDTSSKELLKLANGQSLKLEGVPSGSSLTVSPGDATYYTTEVSNTKATDSSTVEIDDDGIEFTITRIRDAVIETGILDNTNSLSLVMYIFAGCLVVIAGGIAYYARRKKEEN